MKMIIELRLPVTVSMKKFLVSKYGEEYTTNSRDWLGMKIVSLLKPKSAYEYTALPNNMKYPEIYTIKIRISHTDKYGFILTPYCQDWLRRFIESVFRDACFSFALMNKELYNIDYKSSIINFLNFYDIDETQGSYLETLMKDFSRKCIKK